MSESCVGLGVCCAHACEEDRAQLQKEKGKRANAQLQTPITPHVSPGSLLQRFTRGD